MGSGLLGVSHSGARAEEEAPPGAILLMGSGRSPRAQPNCRSTFKASADVTSANIPLARVKSMAKPNVREGKCTLFRVEGGANTC